MPGGRLGPEPLQNEGAAEATRTWALGGTARQRLPRCATRLIPLCNGLLQVLSEPLNGLLTREPPIAYEVHITLGRLPAHVFIELRIPNQSIHHVRTLAGKPREDLCKHGRHDVAEQVKRQLAGQRECFEDHRKSFFRLELR